MFGFHNGENDAIFERTVYLVDEYGVPEPEWDNAYVSWALARQFHLGSIDLADEAAALEFADNRLRTFPFMNYDLRPDIRMKLLEMIEIYDAFKLNYPDYVDLVERMNAADIFAAKDAISAAFGINPEPGHMLSATIGARCEMVCRVVFGYANRIVPEWVLSFGGFGGGFAYRNEPNSLSKEAYLAHLRSPHAMKRYYFFGSRSLDEALPKFIDDLG